LIVDPQVDCKKFSTRIEVYRTRDNPELFQLWKMDRESKLIPDWIRSSIAGSVLKRDEDTILVNDDLVMNDAVQ
ncbi:hypothetical protein E4U12_006610, partial [Claviceps purpurea]